MTPEQLASRLIAMQRAKTHILLAVIEVKEAARLLGDDMELTQAAHYLTNRAVKVELERELQARANPKEAPK